MDRRARDERVESLPNSQRLLAMPTFSLCEMAARHRELFELLRASYGDNKK
jgi:hypothetical protein